MFECLSTYLFHEFENRFSNLTVEIQAPKLKVNRLIFTVSENYELL